MLPARMEVYRARLTGALVARCPACENVCAHWDDDDLNEDGHLMCWHDRTEHAVTDAEEMEVLGW